MLQTAMVLFLIFIGLFARAENRISTESKKETSTDNFGSLSIGHNLSTNNKTLQKNHWTIGTLYAAYGITDQWSVGTSIFVLMDFKMYNVMTRYAFPISAKEKIGFDLAYFKTYGGKAVPTDLCDGWSVDAQGNTTCVSTVQRGEYYTGFLMEAVNAKYTYSNQIVSWYRFNTTLSYFYYFDDRAPFSFRMDPANSDPFTINWTSLHEFKLSKYLFVNWEGGLWGLNYEYLYYHTGLSLGVQNNRGLFAIGASTTFSPTFPKERAKQFAGYDSRYSIHPEIQIQLFF